MTFNSEKTVHVNAYTKSDGTHVKEHYRGLGATRGNSIMDEPKNDVWVIDEDPSSKNILGKLLEKIFPFPNDYKTGMSSNLVLEGGVSVDVGGLDFSNVLSAVLSVTGIALTVGVEAMKYAAMLDEALQKADKETFSKFKPKLQNEINRIKNTQNLSETIQKYSLKSLMKKNKQSDYEKAYKAYIDQRQLNMVNEKTIAKMEYAFENNDYKSVIEELNNYREYNKKMKTTYTYDMVKKNSLWDKVYDEGMKTFHKISAENKLLRTGLHKYPQVEKAVIEGGMWGYGMLNDIHDANEFLKASLYNFEKSGDYIKQNGRLLNSASELPSNLQSVVSDKLYSQLGVYDSKGLVLNSNSTLSNSIINSPEFKRFLSQNIIKILAGQTINGSTNFTGWQNNHLTLGHADIADTFMDNKGNIHAYVIDTYDFNKNDPFVGNEWGNNLQQLKMLTNFFSVSILEIPPHVWIRLLI